jgi:CelD/BcsL family acetyltransferase involved in cellulose biosynthesis
MLPSQRSPDDVYLVGFAGGTGEQELGRLLSSSMRGRLRTKERKLQKLAGYRYFRSSNKAEVDRVLEAFFAQKATHFANQGIANVFAEPGIDEFVRASCLDGLERDQPLIELHALEADGEMLAILGGVADRWRFSSMFNSYTVTEHGRWSPGLILLTHLIAHCADRGIASFDLGAGHASYKEFFCKDSEMLFDTTIPCTMRGRVAAETFRAGRALKRRIKSTPWLWRMAQSMRKRLRS